MSEKPCRDILLYMDDILDGQADETVSTVFNDHLSHCERCRTKVEIFRKIREVVSTTIPRSDETLLTDINRFFDRQTPVVTEPEPKKKPVSAILIAVLCVAVVLGAVAGGIVWVMNRVQDYDLPSRIHYNEEGEVQKAVLDGADGIKLANDEFLKPLGVDGSRLLKNTDGFDALLSRLADVYPALGIIPFRGVVLCECADFDVLNADKNVTYIEGTSRAKIAFFRYDGSYEAFGAAFGDLYEEYYLPSGGSGSLLVGVRLP